jgi:hypothetical protein
MSCWPSAVEVPSTTLVCHALAEITGLRTAWPHPASRNTDSRSTGYREESQRVGTTATPCDRRSSGYVSWEFQCTTLGGFQSRVVSPTASTQVR